jgi:hypothetical protein
LQLSGVLNGACFAVMCFACTSMLIGIRRGLPCQRCHAWRMW